MQIHNEFVLINNVLKELDDIKKKSKILSMNKGLNYVYKTMLSLKCLFLRKVKIQKL